MSKITNSKRHRAVSNTPGGKLAGFKNPQSAIVLKNPEGHSDFPFIICAPGEAVNWQRRYKKALKRLKKTGSPLPQPIEFYNNLRIK